jgi:SPP1 gp7 family putative phage head morphogenesis protein
MSEALERYRGEIWKRVAAPLHSLQGRMTASLRTYFHRAEAAVRRKAKISGDGVDVDWDEAMPPKELERLAGGYIEQAMEQGARRGSKLQRRINSDDPLARVLERRTVQITSIAETVRKDLTERIRAMIVEAAADGWTEEQRLEAVEEIVSSAFNAGSNRARTIARTELFGAYNESEWLTLDSADEAPTHKEWISSRDEVVRDTHQIDGEIVKWDEPFSNGLMYPMDPNGAAADVINCRCIMNPIWEKG